MDPKKFARIGSLAFPDFSIFDPMVNIKHTVIDPAILYFGTPVVLVSTTNPDGSAFEVFARGVRNSVGLAFHPGNGQLWFTENGGDGLGDNRPSDDSDGIGSVSNVARPKNCRSAPWRRLS